MTPKTAVRPAPKKARTEEREADMVDPLGGQVAEHGQGWFPQGRFG